MPRDASGGNDFSDVAWLLRRSWTFGAVHGAVQIARRAARSSRLAARAHALAAAVAQLRREERLSAAALFVVTAAATELLLASIVPERSSPAMPRVIWLVAALVAAVPAVAPRAVLAAWDSRGRRRRV